MPLDVSVASEIGARVVRRAGAGEGLTRGHLGAALAWVPDSPGVASGGTGGRVVVETVRLAGIVVAAWTVGDYTKEEYGKYPRMKSA